MLSITFLLNRRAHSFPPLLRMIPDSKFNILYTRLLLYLCRFNTRKWIIDVTKQFKAVLRPKVNYSTVSHIRQLISVLNARTSGSIFCSVLVPDPHFCGPWIQTVIHSGNPDLDPARIQKQ